MPEIFIPNGPEGGNKARNDGGYITEFSQGPLRLGGELIYYYRASSFGKNHEDRVRMTGGGVFRSRLRIDGFVSVDEGALTTIPLTFSGEDLYLNGNGPIMVELLDLDNGILGAFEVHGDRLDHLVRFNGASLRGILKKSAENPRGQVIKLRFSVRRGACMYSFTIR